MRILHPLYSDHAFHRRSLQPLVACYRKTGPKQDYFFSGASLRESISEHDTIVTEILKLENLWACQILSDGEAEMVPAADIQRLALEASQDVPAWRHLREYIADYHRLELLKSAIDTGSLSLLLPALQYHQLVAFQETVIQRLVRRDST